MKNRILSFFVAMTMIISLLTFVPAVSKADYIESQSGVMSALADSAAFYPGTKRAVADFGIVAMPSEAFMEGGMLYIPLDSANYIFLTMSTTMSGKVYLNGVDVTSSVKTVGSAQFISAKAYANAAGFSFFDDELSDLYIIGRNSGPYTWHNDRKLLSGIIAQMLFDFPTADKIVADVTAKHGVGGHPRILATEETFGRIKAETGLAESDSCEPVKKEWLNSIKSQTATWSAGDPVTYGPTDHIRMREQSGTFWAVGGFNSFMYKLTGEESYAERAWKEISAICAEDFPDWNPNHLLDTGQFMNGMAICYDWLYGWLDDDQKSLMRRNIVDKGISVMCDIFDGKAVQSSWSSSGRSYDFHNGVSNWNFVCCGGALMAALAIFDECEGTDRSNCERVLEECTKILYYSATRFSPSGDWYEGPAYARLSCETMTEACASLASAAGTDYGIMDVPGVSATSEVPFALTGEYSFNISNADESEAHELPNTREFFYHADRFNRDDYAKVQFMLMDEYGVTPDFRDLIYCTRKFESESISLETDYYLKDSEIVTMRNADVKSGLIFAGLHGGANAPAQGHLDVGEFVIDSFGDRFAADLGSENYNLLVDYYTKYRNRAEGHNTLVINPDGRVNDQNPDAVGIITRHEYNESSSIAVVDMTTAYTGYVQSAIRGMKFINDRTSILLQDEVSGVAKKANNESEIYWFMHTKADINLHDDGRVAELDINGNKMYATLLTDGKFDIMPAEPLPNSPNPEGQNPNSQYQKLFVHLTDVTDCNIAVCFTPGIYYETLSLPGIIPIADWTLDKNEAASMGGKLSSLTIDGNLIDNFSPDVYNYEYNTDSSDIPKIEAAGEGSVNIEYPGSLPGTAKITLTYSGVQSVYTVYLEEENDRFEKASFKKLDIIGVYSELDAETNTVDKNSSTNVKLNTGDSIVYELSGNSLANYVSVSGAKADFEVYYSGDGVSYDETGTLSGAELVYNFTPDKYARFVKLVAKSDSCEIAEFTAYGFDGFEYESELEKGASVRFITALYEVGSYDDKRPLTFEGFEIPKGSNSMPDGLGGRWAFGYTSGSKLPIVEIADGKRGNGLRFMAPQKFDTDTNGDKKVDNNDEPREGFENVANNDCQYPRLKYYPDSVSADEYQISFSVKLDKSLVFQLLFSNGSTPVFYNYGETVKCLDKTFAISTKEDSDAWYDFKMVMNTNTGEYEATLTKVSDPAVTSTVSGTSDEAVNFFKDSNPYFYFQQNSYPYAYHEVLIDDLYFGEKCEEEKADVELPVLSYVRTGNAILSDSLTLSDIITIPDDGLKYEASVFVWTSDGIVPVVKKTAIN